MNAKDVRPRAGRREWAGVAVLSLPALLIAMDASVLNLAVPALTREMRPSSVGLLWILDAYTFMVAGFLVTMGALGDRIGCRRLLMIGATGFGAASLLAAYAGNPQMLISARLLLGVAGATLAPSTLALIRNVFQDSQQRALAIAVWAASLSAGGAIGPVVGGAILQSFWWGAVFLPAVPVMTLLLLTAPTLLPEHRDQHAPKLNARSVALSLAAVLPVVYGLKQVAQDGGSWSALVAILIGVLMGVAFLQRQRRLQDPLLDTKMCHTAAVSVSLLANLVGFLVLFGVSLFAAQYLQLVLGIDALQAGLWMLPLFAGFILGSILTPLALRRIRATRLIVAGLLVASAGLAVLTRVAADHGPVVLALGSAMLSVGLAPAFTLVTTIAVESAPPNRAGSAAATSETSTELGAALGVSLLGSVGTAIYRGHLSAAAPAGLPAKASTTAHDSLGAALDTARHLPNDAGTALAAAARAALVHALHAVSQISAIALLLLAVIVGVLLRPPRDDEDTDPSGTAEEALAAQPSINRSPETRAFPGRPQPSIERNRHDHARSRRQRGTDPAAKHHRAEQPRHRGLPHKPAPRRHHHAARWSASPRPRPGSRVHAGNVQRVPRRQAPVRRTGSHGRRRRNRGGVHRHAHRPAGDARRRDPADRSGGPHHDGIHAPLPQRDDHLRASGR
jgi:MFS transporter, DHA2 family, multidrug resistance protein